MASRMCLPATGSDANRVAYMDRQRLRCECLGLDCVDMIPLFVSRRRLVRLCMEASVAEVAEAELWWVQHALCRVRGIRLSPAI
jgi:hypothetical protein